MALVLIGCLSWARGIPPPPSKGALMDISESKELGKLFESQGVVAFNALVDGIFEIAQDRPEFDAILL
jgi:hypothetical protein